MITIRPAFVTASLLALIVACDSSETPPASSDASSAPVAEEFVATRAADAAADPSQIGTATVTIGLIAGAPKFTFIGTTFCKPDGSCGQAGGGSLEGISGNIDLSSFPPGDVLITLMLDTDAIAAGYTFPPNGFDAVAIAVFEPGQPTPDPAFRPGNWPSGFRAPVVAGDRHSVSFTDLESDTNAYEYAIAIDGPNGRMVLDPRIQNGGVGNK